MEKEIATRYRLRNYDYSQNGYYFVTICTRNRLNFFGKNSNGKIVLTDLGEIAKRYWTEIPLHDKGVELDMFVVMPNHIHGIVIIRRSHGFSTVPTKRNLPADIINDHNECGFSTASTGTLPKTQFENSCSNGRKTVEDKHGFSTVPTKDSLSIIIRSYKSAVSLWVNRNGKRNSIWQSRYYDHIIRNTESLDKIRAYIINNPLLLDDKENFMLQ